MFTKGYDMLPLDANCNFHIGTGPSPGARTNGGGEKVHTTLQSFFELRRVTVLADHLRGMVEL